ncbi:O-antigen ligase family protein [bacterium]|nr:O-antigen ligase family protein [bacterium]
MQLPSINQILKSRLFLAGLVFFGVNSTHSYMFYQVNSFKIFLVLIGVSLIAVYNDLIFPKNANRIIPWKQMGIVLLPLLATLPGYFWYKGYYNYNFIYELSSNLILIVWIAYLYRSVETVEDLIPFLVLIGITIIYVGIWAFLERIGYHPLNWDSIPPSRVKATFGNINYFAGFLVVLLPLMLILALPEKAQPEMGKFHFSRFNQFFLLVFIIAGISLILCQTRAALAATIVSLGTVTIIYTLAFLPPKWRKRIITILVTIILLVTIGVFLLIVLDAIPADSRFGKLLTIEGWTPRFVSWQAAIDSITQSPIIGYGLGSSYNLYFQFADPDARLLHQEHSYNHVHSEMLEYMQESGFVGLIIFLVFWIYVAFFLFKIVFTQENSSFLKKISIGLIGGFVGYHLHGLFSVAPRMMVMKLPLFTIIGLAFILDNLINKRQEFASDRTLSQRFSSFLPALIMLVFLWSIFTPWIIGQNKFVNIQRERQSLLKVEHLEEMVESYPDVYALDFLAHLQILYNRNEQLQETVTLIDQILPHYRELGHTKAVLSIKQNDLEKAKTIALEYQNEQDRYYKPTIYLLMSLAFDTNDFQLFTNQYQLFIRKLVYDNNLFRSLNAADVRVPIEKIPSPFIITKQEKEFEFKWNEDLLKAIFNTAQKIRKEKSYSVKERNTFISFMSFHFSKHPYFQIEIKENYKNDDRSLIDQTIKNYYMTLQKINQMSQKLDHLHNLALYQTEISKRPSLQKKQKAEKEEYLNQIQKELTSYSDLLEERTHWSDFRNKTAFANQFIQELSAVVFPELKK